MPQPLNVSHPPFDRLDQTQQQQLLDSLDIAYFRADSTVLTPTQPMTDLHIVIKGVVEERSKDGLELHAQYTHDDMFDVRSLFEGHSRHQYIAVQDTLVYLLPKAVFLDLYRNNHDFAAYFDTNLATRKNLLNKAHQQKNLAEFILTRIDASLYHPPVIVDANCSILSTTAQLQQHQVDAALVTFPTASSVIDAPNSSIQYAIVTRTDMLHALTLQDYDRHHPVGQIAVTPVLTIAQGEYLFHALVMMIRHQIKRLVVMDGQKAVGMIDMTQILSAFSTHSHVLTLAIARANTIEALCEASTQQQKLVETLAHHGIRTRFLLSLLSAVNEQMIEKAFHLVVPPAYQSRCCLIVLGSEGRGEQILKTDQDNALILEDNLDWPDCGHVMSQLTQTLLKLGYPVCSGKVMVNNPAWVKTQSEWRETVETWATTSTPKHLMNIAMMADAQAVAGSHHLLEPIQASLSKQMKAQDGRLQTLARPALGFSLPLTFFGKLKSDLDIKKSGIFPIVHGVRTLCLEYGITERNTFDRIDALVKHHQLTPNTAENLSEALKIFIKLRLKQQLSRSHTSSMETETKDLIHVEHLDRPERDLLRHSFHVVKKFKQWLAYHYQILD